MRIRLLVSSLVGKNILPAGRVVEASAARARWMIRNGKAEQAGDEASAASGGAIPPQPPPAPKQTLVEAGFDPKISATLEAAGLKTVEQVAAAPAAGNLTNIPNVGQRIAETIAATLNEIEGTPAE